jgi:hypothetical protein
LVVNQTTKAALVHGELGDGGELHVAGAMVPTLLLTKSSAHDQPENLPQNVF